jgi:hypothetical protein
VVYAQPIPVEVSIRLPRAQADRDAAVRDADVVHLLAALALDRVVVDLAPRGEQLLVEGQRPLERRHDQVDVIHERGHRVSVGAWLRG